jgi:hypothetical protein
LFNPFRYKVLLSVSNVPAHIWSVETIQEIIGSSCLVFEVAPSSSGRFDLSSFLVVAWACRPDLIPTEVVCSIPEPVEPFVESKLPLFLRVSEILHSMCDLLHFRAFIRLLEVHDFNLPSDCSGDDYRLPSSDSSDEDYPGYDPGRGILNPCPKVSRLATGSSPTGEFWPSLPTAGGGVWSSFESGVTSKAIGSSGVVTPPRCDTTVQQGKGSCGGRHNSGVRHNGEGGVKWLYAYWGDTLESEGLSRSSVQGDTFRSSSCGPSPT